MNINPLGKKIKFKTKYDPSLLFCIPRELQRKKDGVDGLIFHGYDVWHAYEMSWLNNDGLPQVRVARIVYSADSENIVESKSLKFYLASYNMTKFENEKDVVDLIKKDLSKILGASFVEVLFFPYDRKMKYSKIPQKLLLDKQNIKVDTYELKQGILEVEKKNRGIVERYSNLLRSNCPITSHPDWATVYIKYVSDYRVTDSSLLKYIVSYREHADYHESCCEKIFRDLYSLLSPEVLVVKCFYTRRGGIDINPIRFFGEEPAQTFNFHYWRQ